MKRILQTTILVLTVSALVTPTALAERPDDRGGMLGVGAAVITSSSTRPDDRAGTRGPGSLPTVGAMASSSGDGFDWADAGVGAVGAFGLALVLLGGLQVAARGRRDHAAA